jgi:hypothetical protein
MDPAQYYHILDGLWMVKDYYVDLVSRSTPAERVWVNAKIREVTEILGLLNSCAWKDKVT